jgi:two-component system LytT family response regulator
MSAGVLRILIVDDEPIARRRLKALLKGEASAEIVGESEDGESALDAIRRLRPDLVFLDVQMPGLDGFDVIELLKPDECPAVIFVTAYDRYAMRAFDVHAVDYLLKPFERARLRKALARAATLAAGADRPARLHALVDSVRAEQPLRRFLVKAPGRVYAVRADDVESLEAAGHYVELRTAAGTHLVRDSIAAIGRRLDPARFVRIHRSAIVNVDKVKELRPAFHGEFEVVLAGDRRLRCSRTYAAELTRAMDT